MLKQHGRYNYSAINQRQDYSWPDKKRLAVYIALNLEQFAFGEGLGTKLIPSTSDPDVLNYAWRDYGNRVGVWRLLDLFNQLNLPITLLANSENYNYCSHVMQEFRQRGDEIVAYGRTNSEQQSDLSHEDEIQLIHEATLAIKHYEGAPPKGWLGPWISETYHTLDILKATGYEYCLDWCHDDQPTWLETNNGPLLSIPYPQEINDIPAIAIRHVNASEFADMIIDNFDELKLQSMAQPLVFGIALHPYIVGQPFRLKHLRRALTYISEQRNSIWLTYPGAIAQHIITNKL